MLTAADWTAMKDGLAEVRQDNEASIVLRRGATTLTAQYVRVARVASARRQSSDGTRENRGAVVILGATTFDAQIDDRFTLDGVLYRVTFVRPNRRAAVVAEAEAVQ